VAIAKQHVQRGFLSHGGRVIVSQFVERKGDLFHSIANQISKQDQKVTYRELARWDKRLEAEGSCVNDAWGTIMNKEECEAVEKPVAMTLRLVTDAARQGEETAPSSPPVGRVRRTRPRISIFRKLS
jgi:hypothetical protein